MGSNPSQPCLSWARPWALILIVARSKQKIFQKKYSKKFRYNTIVQMPKIKPPLHFIPCTCTNSSTNSGIITLVYLAFSSPIAGPTTPRFHDANLPLGHIRARPCVPRLRFCGPRAHLQTPPCPRTRSCSCFGRKGYLISINKLLLKQPRRKANFALGHCHHFFHHGIILKSSSGHALGL
jgi:hypothetical protein